MSAVHQAKADSDHVPHPVAVSLHDARQSVVAGTFNNEHDINFISTTPSISDHPTTGINHSIYANNASFHGEVTYNVTHYPGDKASSTRDWLLSLSALRFEEKQSANTEIASRGSGAGEWILHSQEFLKWKNGKTRKLLCHGIPGAGKTILASIIINHLDEFIARQHAKRMACIYVYFDYGDRKKQDLTNLLSSLLAQLVQGGDSICPEIKKQHDKWLKTKTKPISSDYLHMLELQVRSFSRVYMVIDALDECLNDLNANTLDSFLNALKRLPHHVHLLFLSRVDSSIEQKVDANTKLEIIAKEDDIRRYVKSRIGDCGNLQRVIQRGSEKNKNKNFLANVCDAVVAKCQGMFLLAQLHMDFLESKHTLEHFESGLDGLPQTPNGVYKLAMERILSQEDEFKRNLAIKALTWLVSAERPLKLPELIEALSVNINDKSVPENRFVTEETLTSSCAGIVVIEQATKEVRLAHYTVEQYLKDNEAKIFRKAQSIMAEVCLVYLSFDEFGSVPETDEDMLGRQEKYAFLSYAANHWGTHVARGVEEELQSIAHNFLSKGSNVRSSLQVMNETRLRFEADVSGLHLATYFGLEKLARELLNMGADVNKTTQRGETALHWAVSYGRAEFVKLLVEQYADLNIRNIKGKCALQEAIMNDDIKLVDALLSARPRPNLELKDAQGWTPLTWSSAFGKTAMVKILLGSGANVDGEDGDGWSALHWAASKTSKEFKGHQRIMNLLIKSGASVEKPDGVKWTMLRWAAQEGLEDRLRELIEKRVNLDAVDDDGLTALHWAIQYRHETTAWMLVRNKANVNKSDRKGYTPLHLAVKVDDRSSIWLLLENGAEVNAATKFGETPLHLASAGGHCSVVWLLLEKGANLQCVDNNGRTALHRAVTEGHSPVARLLIKRLEVLVNVEDDEKQTALHFAASTGNLALTLLLLEHKANIDSRDIDGYTPLHRAVSQRHIEVVFGLVKRGANVHVADGKGLTALDIARCAKSQEILSILQSSKRLHSNN